MFRGLSRSSRRQAFPHMNAGLSLPRAGLLLYLGRPNLEAADVPLGDDTEIGDDTIIRWMFLLPADADIRAATGWVSGVGNIFYDAAGDPVAVLASEIAAWSSVNQWSILFHLVSADTETGRLAIYAQDTPLVTLNKALKVLREDQIDVSPSAFFNGMDFRLATYTGGPTYVPDHLGVLRSPGANRPAVQGMRQDGVAYLNTDESGNPILPSTPQKTVTYNTDWTAKTFAETFDKFDISDPLKAPGWLCEPVRTNYALNSATPATHTTGTIAVGTYTLWQEGAGSIAATAGTAVGTFGTASNGAPATITITIAGTVALTASGTNTWVQLELGVFKTSRIYTTTTPMVRAPTIASFPTAGKIPANNFAIRMIVVPRASGLLYPWLISTYIDSDNYTGIWIYSPSIIFRVRAGGVNVDSTVIMPNLNANIPIDLIAVKSSANMQVSARQFTTSWGSIVNSTGNSTPLAKDSAPIASTYRLGALNSASQYTGNISLFDCVPIPSGITDPMAWAKAHWGVA